ncbi:MAG: ATP-binding protein [Thaumarchaeota archaeon]|nr:ATP-binding protein [Nitrososphaerota archaeon]
MKVLTVSDNGIGMDEYIIRTYFARIGLSYYRSPDFKGQFSPISEFGIGILSTFMIAEFIEVESLKEGAKPINISIKKFSEDNFPAYFIAIRKSLQCCIVYSHTCYLYIEIRIRH